jgi:TRAP-type mannitol/chloroaromatic compound transport system permease small subunit
VNDDFFEGLIEVINFIAKLSERSWPERIVIVSVIGLIIFGLPFCWLVSTYGWPN